MDEESRSERNSVSLDNEVVQFLSRINLQGFAREVLVTQNITSMDELADTVTSQEVARVVLGPLSVTSQQNELCKGLRKYVKECSKKKKAARKKSNRRSDGKQEQKTLSGEKRARGSLELDTSSIEGIQRPSTDGAAARLDASQYFWDFNFKDPKLNLEQPSAVLWDCSKTLFDVLNSAQSMQTEIFTESQLLSSNSLVLYLPNGSALAMEEALKSHIKAAINLYNQRLNFLDLEKDAVQEAIIRGFALETRGGEKRCSLSLPQMQRHDGTDEIIDARKENEATSSVANRSAANAGVLNEDADGEITRTVTAVNTTESLGVSRFNTTHTSTTFQNTLEDAIDVDALSSSRSTKHPSQIETNFTHEQEDVVPNLTTPDRKENNLEIDAENIVAPLGRESPVRNTDPCEAQDQPLSLEDLQKMTLVELTELCYKLNIRIDDTERGRFVLIDEFKEKSLSKSKTELQNSGLVETPPLLGQNSDEDNSLLLSPQNTQNVEQRVQPCNALDIAKKDHMIEQILVFYSRLQFSEKICPYFLHRIESFSGLPYQRVKASDLVDRRSAVLQDDLELEKARGKAGEQEEVQRCIISSLASDSILQMEKEEIDAFDGTLNPALPKRLSLYESVLLREAVSLEEVVQCVQRHFPFISNQRIHQFLDNSGIPLNAVQRSKPVPETQDNASTSQNSRQRSRSKSFFASRQMDA